MQRAGWFDVFHIVGSRKHVIGTFFSIGRREHIDNIIITPTTIFVIGVNNYCDFNFSFSSFIFVSIVEITFLNSSSLLPEGSSRPQSSLCLHGR
jgi:hypothetical protein